MIFLVQIFISALPGNFNSANLILISLIFFLIFNDILAVTYWIVGLGMLMEVVSYLPFGAAIFSLAITIVLTYVILNSWLTNRSLYSLLILTWVATVINNILLWSYGGLFAMLNDQGFILDQKLVVSRLLWSLGLNSAMMIVLFYVLNIINPRLKPFLLLKRY
jgi:hypothetical protein